METEYQKAIGNSMDEVVREVSEFLALPYPIQLQEEFDLRNLLPDLNMAEQLTFALVSEAHVQKWTAEQIEAFCAQAIAPVAGEAIVATVLDAFKDRSSDEYLRLRALYGSHFTLLDGSYWATCLAFGIDGDAVDKVLYYLRLFTVVLIEFAYMDGRNPSNTYVWQYYESFRGMIDELTAPKPLPLKVTKIGGSAGKRDSESYLLSLGVDVQNPNERYMAREVALTITLKDKAGNVITEIVDTLQSIDPDTTYHYGVTAKVCGAATANISATARAASYLKLSTPIMKHVKLSALRFGREEDAIVTNCKLTNEYGSDIPTTVLHYQLLDEKNKIIGGSSERLPDGFAADEVKAIAPRIEIPLPNAKKVLYSTDFDALELVKE